MSKLKGRTRRTLRFQGDIWPIVDQWAQENGFELAEQDESSRIYQRGKGRGAPAKVCRIGREGNSYFLEAWLGFGTFLFVDNSFVFPREMKVDGGGMRARPARDKGKKLVNLLLVALGEPEL